MTAIKVTIHGVGTGTCSLTGKEGADGLTVAFDDQTVNNQFLSWKAFRQLLSLKTGVAEKSKPRTAPATAPANGQS